EERRSGRRYFRDVAVLVCFFSSFPLRLPSCSFWKQALLIPNRFTLNTIHLSCYCYHYSPHLNYRSPLDIPLLHFLATRHGFLLPFLRVLLLRSLRPLLVLLPVPVQVLVLHIVLAVLALVLCLLYKALNRWK